MLSYQADSQETLARFRREAEAAASLDHPNILPIYEVSEAEDGLPFFSMKFAPGGIYRKLRRHCERTAPERPDNGKSHPRRAICASPRHSPSRSQARKHSARRSRRTDGERFRSGQVARDNSDLTRTLTIFGTPGYIAPEQAKGAAAKLTPAADVYSLGAILFDLFTGRPPFLGEHALAVIQQASEKPRQNCARSPALDRDLETICAKCLEREPKARYRSAGDLAEDLERWLEGRPIKTRRVLPSTHAWRWSRRNPSTAMLVTLLLAVAAGLSLIVWNRQPAVLIPKSVAVLPFQNLSPDPDNAYFADGIQEEILTRLAGIADLKVISRTSTQRYQSKPRNLAQIAKQLGVANIVEGSVQIAADQVRISVQLINAQTDAHLWAETYDRKLTDVFLVESDIAKTIADSLKAKLTRSERQAIAVRPTANPEAYELYLKGRFFWNKRTDADLRKAIDYFNHAIAKDPNYALAHAGLADCYDLLCEYSDLSPKESYPKAKAAAIKALELDDTLGEAHTSLAYSLINYDWDWRSAEREYQRAIQLNPNYATARQWYAECLSMLGRHNEAIAEIKRAQQLDPLSLIINQGVGGKYLYARRYDEAMAQFRRTLELYPHFPPTHQRLAWCYAQKRMYDEAITEMQRAVELSGNSTQMIAALGYTYAVAGRRDTAQGIIAELERRSKESYVDNYFVATIFAALGEKDEAFALLNKACAERSYWMPWLNIDFQLDNLRSDSRFDALIQRVFALNQ